MELLDSLATQNDKRILLVVLDGLGGLPRKGSTELESAWIPNLNSLAARSGLGLLVPVGTGITPGSGPAHLALFGYDPVAHQVGRGVLEALGTDIPVQATDLCARANFATLAPDGTIADRRAGRIPTELCTELCARLQKEIPAIEDVEVLVRPGVEHRFVVVFRGPGLVGGASDSDPQHEGERPLLVQSVDSPKSARIANSFIARCAGGLADQNKANFVLLRGLGLPPNLRPMTERFKLKPACVASYPMYRGLARLVGMEVLDTGMTWQSEVDTLRRGYANYDFFFLHLKETDKAGEDGAFETKQEWIELFDEEVLPQLLALKPDVLCVTGDHSTPAELRGHSWHPVPVLLHSPYVRPPAQIDVFGERTCMRGTVGQIRSVSLMGLLLANALKLKKFGA